MHHIFIEEREVLVDRPLGVCISRKSEWNTSRVMCLPFSSSSSIKQPPEWAQDIATHPKKEMDTAATSIFGKK
ncbi:unnamed protein product [Caenorhabditis nigoni]